MQTFILPIKTVGFPSHALVNLKKCKYAECYCGIYNTNKYYNIYLFKKKNKYHSVYLPVVLKTFIIF